MVYTSAIVFRSLFSQSYNKLVAFLRMSTAIIQIHQWHFKAIQYIVPKSLGRKPKFRIPNISLTPISGVMHIFITLYICWHTQSANIHTLEMICILVHSYGTVWKNHAYRWFGPLFMAWLGWSVARKWVISIQNL